MKYSITTQKALRVAFWSQAGVMTDFYRVSYRQNDYSATVRCHWCDYVEIMRKSGQISEKLANRATL